jgi:hypothetical protein
MRFEDKFKKNGKDYNSTFKHTQLKKQTTVLDCMGQFNSRSDVCFNCAVKDDCQAILKKMSRRQHE